MKAPEKLYIDSREHWMKSWTAFTTKAKGDDIEYIRTDVFVEKAKGWFENHPEQYDANGVRCYGIEDFEDFLKAMKL